MLWYTNHRVFILACFVSYAKVNAIRQMKLALVTFELDEDHPALAWQAEVVAAFAKHCSQILVLTSRVGRFRQPNNVHVELAPRGGAWWFNPEFYRMCRQHQVEGVFVHMAMEWAYRLLPTCKALRLPVVMWYAHGTVTQRLRWAVRSADRIVTSTSEGCRVASNKIQVIGQGINTRVFSLLDHRKPQEVLYVGRISPRKRIELLLETAHQLKKLGKPLPFRLVGPVLSCEDHAYEKRMRLLIRKWELEDVVSIEPAISRHQIPSLHNFALVHLSLSNTGSLDKTLLESLACGCPILTSNPAFRRLLRKFPELYLEDETPENIAKQILLLDTYDPMELRALVDRDHSLDTYPNRVFEVFSELGLK